MDGIDVALIETDGEGIIQSGPTFSQPYSGEIRATLAEALEEAKHLTAWDNRPGSLADIEAKITRSHNKAVQDFLQRNELRTSDIDIIGFHGQTVLHRPDKRLTVQLGDGPLLARLTGIDVVYDFRANDVAAGGHGAPFVPIYHKGLVEAANLERPVVVVNIGGVANVTWIGDGGELLAFDTGPGNALIDDWVKMQTNELMDKDGALASQGLVQQDCLDVLMSHPYFDTPPPKSLDRNAFSLEPVQDFSIQDGAATLVAFTAETIARAADFMKTAPQNWVVSGGGARNPVLFEALAGRVSGTVQTADAVGWSADFVEAQAFAYLAVRSLRGLLLSFPETTGVSEALTGGVLAKAESP